MADEKAWYQSKTIWGALIASLAPLIKIFAPDLDISPELADALAGGLAAIGGIVAIIGRLTAKKDIAPKLITPPK